MARSLADAKNNAEGLLYTTMRSLDEYGYVLDAASRARIDAALARLRAVLQLDDVTALEDAIRALETLSFDLADRMLGDSARSQLPRLSSAAPHELVLILDYLLHSASAMLEQQGECWPLAAVVDRELGLSAFAVEDDATDAAELLAGLVQRLQAAAIRGELVATGTCAQVVGPDVGPDAIAIELDHEDGASLMVVIELEIANGKVRWGRSTERPGSRLIFRPS